jgi:hypothetical protein
LGDLPHERSYRERMSTSESRLFGQMACVDA